MSAQRDPGDLEGTRGRKEKARPLTVLWVDTSLCDFIQDLGDGAHRDTAFYPEDGTGHVLMV